MESDQATDRPVTATAMARLLELQGLDLSVDRLRARLGALEGGGEVRQARTAVAEAESRLGELRLSLDEVVRDQRRLEGDLDSLQRKIEAERNRLYDGSVANAKELQSIQAEVESLRVRRSRIEDDLLEQMEQREELEGRLGPLEAELAAAKGRQADLESTTARELVQTETALTERERERAELSPSITAEVLDLYEDLRRQKKGVGVAALSDGVCQGCHQKLSPVYLEGLKRTEGIRRCEYCRRILVPV